MECLVCNHPMVQRNVTLNLRTGEKLLVIEDVPATVCENCGEKVFTPEITRQVQTMAKEHIRAGRNARTTLKGSFA